MTDIKDESKEKDVICSFCGKGESKCICNRLINAKIASERRKILAEAYNDE